MIHTQYMSGFQSAPGTGAPGDATTANTPSVGLKVSIRSRDRSPGRLVVVHSIMGLYLFQSAPGTGAPGDNSS